MFYIVKHIPTNTWAPKLRSSRERSHYYAFLEGKASTFNVTDFTFDRGFKYKQEQTAQIFIDKMPIKLRVDLPAEDIKAQFKIFKYEFYPYSELKLIQSQTVRRFTQPRVQEVEYNWIGKSKTYCSCCGAYIPVGLKYFNFGISNVCLFCLDDVHTLVNDAKEEFKDVKLLEQIQISRFVEQI